MKETDFDIGMMVIRSTVAELVVFSNLLCNLGTGLAWIRCKMYTDASRAVSSISTKRAGRTENCERQ